jgi:hypothetical protein
VECTHLFDKNSIFVEGTIERIALSVKPIGVTKYGSFKLSHVAKGCKEAKENYSTPWTSLPNPFSGEGK